MFIGAARYVVAAIVFGIGTTFWGWEIGAQAIAVFLITEFTFQAFIS